MDLAKLFLSCCFIFGIDLFRDMESMSGFNPKAFAIKTQMTKSVTRATVVKQNNTDFLLSYGIVINLTRTFQVDSTERMQTIFLKVDDPISLCGLTLCYAESNPEIDPDFMFNTSTCRVCYVKIPSLMIKNWEDAKAGQTIDDV
jgi:hypothetical protein